IYYIDRATRKEEKERIYGDFFVRLLYGGGKVPRLAAYLLIPLVAKLPFLSRLYAAMQKSGWSRRKIAPFIKKFHIDASEFLEPPESFSSFDSFFIRKLKSGCRPLCAGHDVAIMPADGRFLVYPNIQAVDGFLIKGKKFSLEK